MRLDHPGLETKKAEQAHGTDTVTRAAHAWPFGAKGAGGRIGGNPIRR
jgi:hypothetical protein